MLSACSNEPESIISKGQKSEVSSDELTSNEPVSAVEGYKEFKFGMSSSEIARTKACDKSYRYFSDVDRLPGLIEDAKAKLQIDRNEEKINWHQKRIEEATSTIQRCEKQLHEPNSVGESFRQPYWALESTIERMNKQLIEDRKKLAELKETSATEANNPQIRFAREVQPLIDKYELAQNYDLSVTNDWLRQSQNSCKTEIMGFQRNMQFWVYPDSGFLAKITIHLGEYKDEVFHSIADSLSTKYKVTNLPDDTQVKMFNEFGLDRVSVSYAGGQVMLVANNYRSYRGNERDMELVYSDSAAAAELNRLNDKGRVNANDL
jgi:hypothetical protein